MSLVLRLQKDSALTNQELDNNFTYLDGRINTNQTAIATIVDDTIPELISDTTALLSTKQPLNAKLTSLSGVGNGIVSMSSGVAVARTIEGSTNISVTNGDGVEGNPTISLSTDVVTTSGAQTLTNKNINGNSNTISNVSLTQAVSGVLPIANGGTNANTAEQARVNLNVVTSPTGNGIVVKTGADTSVSRSIAVSGTGLSVTNASGDVGNPTVVSNATAANTPSTIVARDSSGNFTAGTITANVVGNVTGNASTVTNGIVSTQTYSNPAWITSLAGSKITSIPNTSLQNPAISINGTSVALGGSITLDVGGVATNTPNANIKRDGSGNFAAGTITATLNGNASTATSAQASITAQRLQTARTINGVSFDGSQNITIADSSKLPLSGGTLTGSLTLAGNPTQSNHAVNKSYVDSNLLTVTYGSVILSTGTDGEVLPPAGKTMSSLAGFLPAMGSSFSATPTYSTNIMIAIDVSGSASSNAIYNGTSYATAFDAAAVAAKYIINHYAAIGPCNVCLIRQSNASTGIYKWTTPAQALLDLNDIRSFTGTLGTIPQAYNVRPSTTSQSVFYFFSDCNHSMTAGAAFGGSEAAWRTFLNTNSMPSYGVCVDNSGNPSNINQISWDGRSGTDMNGFRASADTDIPTAYSPGLYNTGSIEWLALSDRIRVSLTEGSDVSNVAVNWLALWS